MKTVILKWKLDGNKNIMIETPRPVKFLTAQWQNDAIVIWGEVESDKINSPKFPTLFSLEYTGLYPSEKGTYLATIQVPSGLVIHIYYNLQ